jgi:hypothetical protein
MPPRRAPSRNSRSSQSTSSGINPMLLMMMMMRQQESQQVLPKALPQQENPMSGLVMATLMKKMQSSSNSNDDEGDDSGYDYDYDYEYDNDDYDYDYEEDDEEDSPQPNPMSSIIQQMVQQKLIAMHQSQQTTDNDEIYAPSPLENPSETPKAYKPRVEIAQRPVQPTHKEILPNERVSYRSAP